MSCRLVLLAALCASLTLLQSTVWASPHPAYKPVRKTGISTYKDRQDVGQVIFALKPISKDDKKPAGTISELTIPKDVNKIAFYIRSYYPETVGNILKSVPNKTRGVGSATEVWVDNEMIWRASGDISADFYADNTNGYNFDDGLNGKEDIIQVFQKLAPGKHSLTIWKLVYFEELRPHPDTGVARFVDGRIFTAMGSIELNKQ